MNLLSILGLSVALAMDAFAVSIAAGLSIQKPRIGRSLEMAAAFGLFQAGMALAGWFAGGMVGGFIAQADHWVAFGLLGLVGARMIREGMGLDRECHRGNFFQRKTILLLAVATSIDALAAGVSLALVATRIWIIVASIGLVTFALSAAGLAFGRKLGCAMEGRAKIAGGLMLIAIGIKILIDHLAI